MGLANSKKDRKQKERSVIQTSESPISVEDDNTTELNFEETPVIRLKPEDLDEPEFEVNEIHFLRECRSSLFELVEKTDDQNTPTEKEQVTETGKPCKLTLSEFERNEHCNKTETIVRKISIRSNDTTDDSKISETDNTTKHIGQRQNKMNNVIENEDPNAEIDFPISEAEKMLQLYKKEQSLHHVSANTNKKEKLRHRPKPQYKTSNLYETDDRRLRTPTRIESDLVVHPSTSTETINSEIKKIPINSTVHKADVPSEPTVVNIDDDKGKTKGNLTRSVLEERSPYTKDPSLIPAGVGKPGSEKMRVWRELVEQQIVPPEQWSELKQQDTLRELASTGLLGRERDDKYTMSIGAPRRRPPPRLNQIPPLDQHRTEFTDLFSNKIPNIERNKTGYVDLFTTGTNKTSSNIAGKTELKTANVIAVSEASEKEKLENIEAIRQGSPRMRDREINASGKQTTLRFADHRAVNKKNVSFLDKELYIDDDAVAKQGQNIENDDTGKTMNRYIENNQSGVGSKQIEESEYFEALNGERYTELQKRKLRLWDIDTM